MKIVDCVQGSQEWHDSRLGRITASRVHDILPGRNGYKAARKNYKAQLISEILTGNVQDSYVSYAMEYGKETESMARSAYEAWKECLVQEVGFVIHEKYDYLGCSPDGLCNNRGIEIKCFNTANHIDAIERSMKKGYNIKSKYYTQIQVGMMCTGLMEWDFVSYDCRLPEGLQLYVQTVPYDWNCCYMAEKEIIKFYDELQETLKSLKTYQERWLTK